MPEPDDKDLTRIAGLAAGDETSTAPNGETPPVPDSGDPDATRFSSTPDAEKTRFAATPEILKTLAGAQNESDRTRGTQRTQAGWQKTRVAAQGNAPTTPAPQDDDRIGLVLNELWKVQEFI